MDCENSICLTREIHLFTSYFVGFSLTFCFIYAHHMIACYYEHLVLEIWGWRHVWKKSCRFQIWQSICSQSNPGLWNYNYNSLMAQSLGALLRRNKSHIQISVNQRKRLKKQLSLSQRLNQNLTVRLLDWSMKILVSVTLRNWELVVYFVANINDNSRTLTGTIL